MPIECACPSCGQRFRAADTAAGKVAKCPKCGIAIRLPDRPTTPTPPPKLPTAPPPATGKQAWFVRSADQKQHGPMDKAQLDYLVAGGQFDAFSEVRRSDWPDWKPIEDVYPALAIGADDDSPLYNVAAGDPTPRRPVVPRPKNIQQRSLPRKELPGATMIVIGVLLLLVGALGLVFAISMDTTVPTEFGRVHNTGLLDERRNYLLFASVIAVIGTIFLSLAIHANIVRGTPGHVVARIVLLALAVPLCIPLLAGSVYLVSQLLRQPAPAPPPAPAPVVQPAPPPAPAGLAAAEIATCKEEVASATARQVDNYLRQKHEAMAQASDLARELAGLSELAQPPSRKPEAQPSAQAQPAPSGPYQSQFDRLHRECLAYIDGHLPALVPDKKTIWDIGEAWAKAQIPEGKLLEDVLRSVTPPAVAPPAATPPAAPPTQPTQPATEPR